MLLSVVITSCCAFSGGRLRAALHPTRASAVLPRASVVLSEAGLVLAPSRTAGFDDKVVGSACVRRFVYDEGESWMMWYSARGEDFDQEVLPIATGKIGLATSEDGISWKREGPVLTSEDSDWYWFDTTHVGVGDVQVMSSQSHKTGGVAMYWCYYFGGDQNRKSDTGPKGSSMAIGLAMSSNGRNWGRVEGEHPSGAILVPSSDESQFDAAFVGWPQVVMRGKDDYLLYYHTISAAGEYVVAAARGTDGVKFTKIGPILTAGPPGSFDARGAGARHVIEVKPSEGKPQPRFLMVYEAISDEGVHSIGLARSADGIKWDKQKEPIFSPSTRPGAWDGGAVGRPSLVPLDHGRYRMYYYGQSGRGAGAAQEWTGIGMAECDGSDWSSWKRVEAAHDPRA